MKTQRINFTQKTIDTLPVPEKGQQIYYDTGPSDGLCLRVSYGGSKTYFFQMYFQGRGIKTKIGSAKVMKLAEAKQKAHTLREMAEQGSDPTQKRRDELRDMTLKQFYENIYKPRHSIPYKRPKSVQKDDTIVRNNFGSLSNRRMMTITRADVERRHNAVRDNVSLYTANRVVTLIKHMYNKAHEWGYPKQYESPAIGIKLFPEKSRDRFLQPEELQRFLPNWKMNQMKNFAILSNCRYLLASAK